MGRKKLLFKVRKCGCKNGDVCLPCQREIADMIFWRKLETYERLGGYQPRERRMPRSPRFLERW